MKTRTGSDWLSLLLGLEIVLFVYLVFSLLLAWRNHRTNLKTKQLLEANSLTEEITESKDTFLRTEFSNQLALRLLNTRYGKWFENKCLRAGIWQTNKIMKWAGFKFEFSLGGALLALFGFEIINWSFYLVPLFAILGFFTPDLRLIKKGDARVSDIVKSLPETIDLLNMTVEAGLGFQAGLERISRMKSNPASDEFRRVLTEIRLGDSRSRAFASMAERVNRSEVWSFTNSIAQVEKLGIPITNALRDQALRMRSERKEKAKEIAQKLPVKILAPIMLLLLPSVLIIVLGPAIYIILQSL